MKDANRENSENIEPESLNTASPTKRVKYNNRQNSDHSGITTASQCVFGTKNFDSPSLADKDDSLNRKFMTQPTEVVVQQKKNNKIFRNSVF